MSINQSRDSHIDNIKILLLFLVAYAHNLIPFKEESVVVEQVIKIIYLFHMPLFTFCTGYLVRKSKRNVWNYIKKLLLPYIVFQLCYVFLGTIMIYIGIIDYSTNTMTRSMIEPSSPLYFLVCMMIWRLLCEVFKGIPAISGGKDWHKIAVGITLILCAVLLSIDPYANTMVLPVFSLLPFYYFGYIADWKQLKEKIDKIPWWGAVIAVLLYLGISCIVPYETILFRVNIWEMNMETMPAILSKFMYYIAALLGCAVVIRIITGKVVKYITNKSVNGMIIYIGSSFISPYLYILLYNKIKILQSGIGINMIGIIIFTLVSIEILSWNCWKKLYDNIFGRFTS